MVRTAIRKAYTWHFTPPTPDGVVYFYWGDMNGGEQINVWDHNMVSYTFGAHGAPPATDDARRTTTMIVTLPS